MVGRYERTDAPRSLSCTRRHDHEPDAPDTLVMVDVAPLDAGVTRSTLRNEPSTSEELDRSVVQARIRPTPSTTSPIVRAAKPTYAR